jgi:tetratricopeptide (TPR) repeat protein
MSPQLRRFLGPGRSWHEREAEKQREAEAEQETSDIADAPPIEPEESQTDWPSSGEAVPPPPSRPEKRRSAPAPSPAVVPDQKISRVLEMQTLVFIVGGFILVGAAFYAGTKVRYVKAFLAGRNKPEITNVDSKKFPGLTADELVEQALAAERIGNWKEAVERLLVAKRRNISYRGLLFRAGKLCYDHGDFDSADRLLDRAIAFGDQVDTANYLRGLIAVGRNDLPTAEQFFEAAVNAEPFTPGYYYYLGEALRREHRPNDAANRYDQAANRTVNEQDAALCRFKARMARSEIPDRSQLRTELEQRRAAGPLTVDWALTDAALKIRAGQFNEAADAIREARAGTKSGLPTLFASCISDMLFTDAAANHPEIAAACQLDTGPTAKATPFGSP